MQGVGGSHSGGGGIDGGGSGSGVATDALREELEEPWWILTDRGVASPWLHEEPAEPAWWEIQNRLYAAKRAASGKYGLFALDDANVWCGPSSRPSSPRPGSQDVPYEQGPGRGRPLSTIVWPKNGYEDEDEAEAGARERGAHDELHERGKHIMMQIKGRLGDDALYAHFKREARMHLVAVRLGASSSPTAEQRAAALSGLRSLHTLFMSIKPPALVPMAAELVSHLPSAFHTEWCMLLIQQGGAAVHHA